MDVRKIEGEFYPVIKENIWLYLSPTEGAIYFGPNRKYSINPDAQKILLKCNGENTLYDIVKELTTDTYYFHDNLRKARDFFLFMERENIIEFIPFSLKRQLNSRGDLNRPRPIHASIELTDKCNFRCVYCYRDSSPQKNHFLLGAISLLGGLKTLGVRTIELTGGEPTLHTQFKDILKYSIENFEVVGILTNGTCLTEDILKVTQGFERKIAIQICLDGSCKESVEASTQIEGSYERIVNSIQLVKKYGLPLRIGMVIDAPSKINEMEKTLLLAKSLGANSFIVNPVFNFGRGEDVFWNFSLDDNQKFQEELLRLSSDYKDFFNVEGRNLDISISSFNNCGAGHRTIVIDFDRKIRPCPLILDERLSFGKYTDSYLELFFNYNENLVHFARLTSPNQETCTGCIYYPYCIGCLVRGLKKALDIGFKNCKWIKRVENAFLMNFFK